MEWFVLIVAIAAAAICIVIGLLALVAAADAGELPPAIVGLFFFLLGLWLVYDTGVRLGKDRGVIAATSGKATATRIDHGDKVEWQVKWKKD